MDLDLRDKVAIVAGSSRGIGLAIARAFLQEGARVLVSGRDQNHLEHAKQFLCAEGGQGRAAFFCGDLRSQAAVEAAVRMTLDVFGRIDAAVGAVGSGTAKPGWDLTLEEWESAIETNLLSSMALSRAVMPHLIATRGSLTFISSIAGCESINAPVPYGAAKAALQNAVKSLARLAGAQGVRINAVAPGNVLFPGGTWDRKLEERREFFEQYIQSEVPLKRFGSPEEIADAVVFLASPRASFITGACLVVDGGQTRSIY